MVSLVSNIGKFGVLVGVAAASAYLMDAVTPMGMMSGKKIYSIGNWVSLGLAVAGVVAAIAAAVLSDPILGVVGALLACSGLMAAYSIKRLANLQTIEQDTATLKKINTDLSKTVDTYKQEVEKEKSENDRLAKDLDLEKANLAALKKEKADWDTAQQGLQTQVQQFQKVPDDLKVQLTGFSQGVNSYIATAKQAGVDITKYQQIATALGKDVDSMAAVKDQLTAMQQLFQLAIQQEAAYKTDLDTLTQQVQQLGSINQQLKQSIQDAQKLDDKVQHEVDDQIGDADAAIAAAKKLIGDNTK